MKALLSVGLGALFFAPAAPPARGGDWATERGVQIDRVACAWFASRFLDPAPRFVFFEHGKEQPPEGATGYDYFGAEYFHEGPGCSFTALIKRHRPKDRALQKMEPAINDVFGWRAGPNSLSALFKTAIAELRDAAAKDDPDTADAAVLARMLPILDLFYLHSGGASKNALPHIRGALASSRELAETWLRVHPAPVEEAAAPPADAALRALLLRLLAAR